MQPIPNLTTAYCKMDQVIAKYFSTTSAVFCRFWPIPLSKTIHCELIYASEHEHTLTLQCYKYTITDSEPPSHLLRVRVRLSYLMQALCQVSSIALIYILRQVWALQACRDREYWNGWAEAGERLS